MNKKNVKQAIKEIIILSDEMEIGISMDNAMDGSGECGDIILRSWILWFNKKLSDILKKHNVTMSEILICSQEWANKELSMRPKKEVFIRAFSRREGFYKPIDYFDTKYGSVNFIIQQLN